MLKRIRKTIKLWKLSKEIESEALEDNTKTDGVFLSYMTREEADNWIHENEHGWKKFNDKLREILK